MHLNNSHDVHANLRNAFVFAVPNLEGSQDIILDRFTKAIGSVKSVRTTAFSSQSGFRN